MKRACIECGLVTSRVQRWLQNGRPARILHLFDQVCNLVDDHGEIISLASLEVGPGPFTMVMEEDFGRHLSDIDLQQRIVIDDADKSLSIGSLTISWERASLWDAMPQWSRLQDESGTNWPVAEPFSTDIESHITKLLEAIAARDATGTLDRTCALAGLGQGLTPAGDDILMGIIFALWIWRPQKDWINLMVETAVPRTTTLSAAFLQAAASGEATYHWHDLVNGLSGSPSGILSIGQSSGNDAWGGFIRAQDYLRLICEEGC